MSKLSNLLGLKSVTSSEESSLLPTLLLGGALGYSIYDSRKARKRQEKQFREMMDKMSSPDSLPKPLKQTGGGGIEPVQRRGSQRKARRRPSANKANQGLLAIDSEPSLLK